MRITFIAFAAGRLGVSEKMIKILHAQGKARMFIDSLKHPTEKAIYASRGVATNLAVLATDSLRRAVLKDWANALLNLDVMNTVNYP